MNEGVVHPVHRLGIGATLAHGYLSFSLNGGWGTETQNHGGWGYRLHAATLRGLLGAGWQKWMLRLDVDSGAEMQYLRQNYTDGETRDLWGLWLGGSVRGGYAIPTSRPVYLAVRVGLGAQYAPPVAVRSVKQIWFIAPLVEVSAGMLY
jgi:hypothetical protein